MQILAIDIGTGTQDILLLDTDLTPENGLKLVMPSPTMIVRGRIQEATSQGKNLLLTGHTMGGGPSLWAVEEHIRRGLKVFATPDAARTFNDDLEWIQQELGLILVNSVSPPDSSELTRVEMRDFDFRQIVKTFEIYGVDLKPDAVGIAVFDHGAAPPEISDRKFRFDYIEQRMIHDRSLTTFAFITHDIPEIMTRMHSVVASSGEIGCPSVLMDTAPAAVLGATFDPVVTRLDRKIIVNVGNFHTLAFRMHGERIEGLFEHHTGMLTQRKLESLLLSLASGSLCRDDVFNDGGHGAWIPDDEEWELESYRVVVTGPRRNMLYDSRSKPYFAVPYGDMMLTGCFGLVSAIRELVPSTREAIGSSFASVQSSTAPWDVS